MNKVHKFLVGLFVALAVAIPLAVLAATPTQSERAPIVRVATDPTDTPRPPGSGCHGEGC